MLGMPLKAPSRHCSQITFVAAGSFVSATCFSPHAARTVITTFGKTTRTSNMHNAKKTATTAITMNHQQHPHQHHHHTRQFITTVSISMLINKQIRHECRVLHDEYDHVETDDGD